MRLWTSSLILGGSSLLLVQCTPVLQGEPVDLAVVGTPDPVVTAKAPLVPPAPVLHQHPGRFRAWIPRVVSPNGDVVEGHYLEVSTTAPAQETVEPSRPIPRPPKVPLPKDRTSKRKGIHQPPEAPPESVPSPMNSFPGYPGLTPPMPGGPHESLVP